MPNPEPSAGLHPPLPSVSLPRLNLGSIVKVSAGDRLLSVDHLQLRDISLGAMTEAEHAVSAFGSDPVNMKPVISVRDGARCNCYAYANWAPHLQGTHIEARGHILAEPRPVAEHLRGLAFIARLISVEPVTARGMGLSLVPDERDLVIPKDAVVEGLAKDQFRAPVLILRTPNFEGKKSQKYGNTNPPYPHHEVATWAVSQGINHIVLDLPSADREQGELLFHRTFWQDPINARGEVIPELNHVPNDPRNHATITELGYIANDIPDGWYLIYLNPIVLPGDAAPVRPMIAPILEMPG